MAVTVTNTDAGLSGKTLDLLESDQTITGLKTFNRGASAPFAVPVGAAVVTNLDADKLDGQDGAYYAAAAALNASALTSGTVPTARLGTGTADATSFLRGDQTWAEAGDAITTEFLLS